MKDNNYLLLFQFNSLLDRLLENYQDCLCRPPCSVLLHLEDVARVPKVAGHQGEDQGSCQDPHQDRRDKRGQASRRPEG